MAALADPRERAWIWCLRCGWIALTPEPVAMLWTDELAACPVAACGGPTDGIAVDKVVRNPHSERRRRRRTDDDASGSEIL